MDVLRAAVLISICAASSGCATSGALTLFSLGASTLSFAVSGKTLSDHALSTALQRDCSLLRPLTGGPLCTAEPALASGEPAAEREAPGSRPTTIAILAEARGPDGALHPVAEPAPRAADAADPPDVPRLFAVVGSFRQEANAQRLAAREWGFAARVAAARLRGAIHYRVLLGPIDGESVNGVAGSWPIRLCSVSFAPPPCSDTLVAHAG